MVVRGLFINILFLSQGNWSKYPFYSKLSGSQGQPLSVYYVVQYMMAVNLAFTCLSFYAIRFAEGVRDHISGLILRRNEENYHELESESGTGPQSAKSVRWI